MRQLAVCAVLDAFFRKVKIPAAFVPQCIEWAIAEKAVEILRVCALMTGKIFTCFMTEIGILLVFPMLLFHQKHLRKKEGAMLFRVKKLSFISMRGENENPKQYRLPFNRYNSHEQAIIP